MGEHQQFCLGIDIRPLPFRVYPGPPDLDIPVINVDISEPRGADYLARGPLPGYKRKRNAPPPLIQRGLDIKPHLVDVCNILHGPPPDTLGYTGLGERFDMLDPE